VGEVWERLKAWYIENGTLTVEVNDKGKEKQIWIDQPGRYDPNVKGAHQLVSRLQKLFPKITRGKRSNGKGIPLSGLGWADEANLSIETDSDPTVITQRSYSDPTFEAENLDEEGITANSDPTSPKTTKKIASSEFENSKNSAKNGLVGSLSSETLSQQEFQPTKQDHLQDHSGITVGSLPNLNHKPELSGNGKHPPPDNPPLAVGDHCRYVGSSPGKRNLCGNKPLLISQINNGVAEVAADGWYVKQEIPISELRRVRSSAEIEEPKGGGSGE
jgi:hypothetical protein